MRRPAIAALALLAGLAPFAQSIAASVREIVIRPAVRPIKPVGGLPPSYYPHWVVRDGVVATSIMDQLAPGTMIAAHHEWSLDQIRRILDHPGKGFRVAWYIEANVEESDDPTPVGTPVVSRIKEARRKQDALMREYGVERFANLIELNGSRDKKDGNLSGEGNRPADWMRDAEVVASVGFRYIAKSPALAHVDELRARFGRDFVPRIVFEDVTAGPGDGNPGYRSDARALARRGDTLTLIVHEGAYGGFPATSLDKAQRVIESDFQSPHVEMYWGRKTARQGFVKVKSFSDPRAPSASRGPLAR
jgi:hypothetical protein